MEGWWKKQQGRGVREGGNQPQGGGGGVVVTFCADDIASQGLLFLLENREETENEKGRSNKGVRGLSYV